MLYQKYNREERNICAHLFRLLHEPVDNHRALRLFLNCEHIDSFALYCEVALIRDAYHVRKPYVNEFLDNMVKIIADQEGISQFRLYSQLPHSLNDSNLTHPGQIRKKAKTSLLELTDSENKVYASLQAMFNAKPDLAVCLPDKIIIYEAKFTLGFDVEQIARTKNIGQIWSQLLYKDLGYEHPVNIEIKKLGLAKFNPDIPWTKILEIAQNIYPTSDKSLLTFTHALEMN